MSAPSEIIPDLIRAAGQWGRSWTVPADPEHPDLVLDLAPLSERERLVLTNGVIALAGHRDPAELSLVMIGSRIGLCFSVQRILMEAHLLGSQNGSEPEKPQTITVDAPELPDAPDMASYRRRVLLTALENLARHTGAVIARPGKQDVYLGLPQAWMQKARGFLESRDSGLSGKYPGALIKIAILEFPLSAPVPDLPVTALNAALRLRNSILQSRNLLGFAAERLERNGAFDFWEAVRSEPGGEMGAEKHLRRLARSQIRWAVEIPELLKPTGMQRMVQLLHDNVRAMAAWWSEERLIVPGTRAAHVHCHFLKARQEALEAIVAALTNDPVAFPE